MKKNIFAVLLIVMFVTTFGAVGPSNGAADKTQKMTIAAPVGPADGPLYVANEKGYLKEEGLDAEIVPFTSGRLALDALLGGKANVAMVAETPLALAAFQGHKFYIIATMTESPHKLVIRKSANVLTPQDLKGKKVSALMGSAGAFWMYSYLKTNGLSMSNVNVVNLQPPDMVAALVRGDIDAFFSWEPFPYHAKKELGDKVIISSSENIYMQTFNVVVMQDYAKKNPLMMDKLVLSLLKAEKFLKQNRKESVQIVAKSSGMDEVVLNSIWDDHKFAISLNSSLLTYLQQQGEWAVISGIAPTGVNAPDYRLMIYDDVLKRMNPNAVHIK